ncbi:MAG: hypothetical protein J07HX64_02223 [halophilic archaeon J07HX64]|nr:MAG: hypothetical protein J07HX64_02223 [halophilic archaeon J07HX64]
MYRQAGYPFVATEVKRTPVLTAPDSRVTCHLDIEYRPPAVAAAPRGTCANCGVHHGRVARRTERRQQDSPPAEPASGVNSPLYERRVTTAVTSVPTRLPICCCVAVEPSETGVRFERLAGRVTRLGTAGPPGGCEADVSIDRGVVADDPFEVRE